MTKPPTLTIAHLYPAEMNIYGDMGNILTLVKRLEWRGLSARVQPVELGSDYDFTKADIIFGGGGQDRGQLLVAQDLQRHRHSLQQAAEAGVVMLVVCGLYQLFGHSFITQDGRKLPGIGIFDCQTVAGKERLIGNVVEKTSFGRLVGFENHSGQTRLGEGQAPLGQILKGSGNDTSSGTEGAVTHNVFGTYLHGPLLPKNPLFADQLIKLALERHQTEFILKPLDDSLETEAAAVAAKRPN